MLKITEQTRKIIGNRIRTIRRTQHKTQDALKYIDKGTLSKIENGKVVKKTNPKFINESNVFAISEGLNMSPNEVLYGNIKYPLIKIIILAVLMNSEDNPFMNISYEEWLDEYWKQNIEKQNKLKENRTEYEFFISKENYTFYESMNVKYHEEYETVSNLILKLILQDYNFSKYFCYRLINYAGNLSSSPNKYENMIEAFILNKGIYSLAILDKEGTRYPEFILAFNKFWNKFENEYVDFFNEHIFFSDEELLKHGLTNFSDENIHAVLSSNEFIELNEKLLFLAEYKDEESIISSLNLRFEMINKLREEKQDKSIEQVNKIHGLSANEKNDLIRNIIQDDFAVCFSETVKKFNSEVELLFNQ